MELAAAARAEKSPTGLLSTSNCRSLVQAWREHGYILPSILVSVFVCVWFVTWGDWDFFAGESFCKFYDAQALSLTHGRLDVPANAIGFEAYQFAGKTYGYFGIGPALLRLPLILALGDLDGLSSRAMMMVACIANLVCAYGILRTVRANTVHSSGWQRLLDSLFVICAGIGSTNVFLMGRSFVFHEASMWGGAFALAWAWALIRYFQTGHYRWLMLACVFAFFSFQSRPTAGAGTLLGLAMVAAILIRHSETRTGYAANRTGSSHALGRVAIVGTALLITLGTYFAVNYAKFRTLNGIPVRYYQLYMQNADRMRVTGGRQIHVENIPTNAANYFGWHGLRLTHDFPWLLMNDRAQIVGSPALDVVEPFSSLPVSMPALSVLAFLGAVAIWRGSGAGARHARIPALALLAGGSIVLMTVGITERYLHDFYPLLIVSAAVGTSTLQLSRLQRITTLAIALLTIFSVAANCSFALVFQRTAHWGVPADKRSEFATWQQSIGAFFEQGK